MEIQYYAANGVGHLLFSVYNGAMDLDCCKALLNSYNEAVNDATTKVIVLWGGDEFFSNGIDLNSIHLSYNPAIMAYRNLKALNKLVSAILNTHTKMVVAGLSGCAAAGGVMLALAADLRYARQGIVLNPSYANLGLCGSEYWSILLPSMVGYGHTQKLLYETTPIGSQQAASIGLIHDDFPCDHMQFKNRITAKAEYLANTNIEARLVSKNILNSRLLKDMETQVQLELKQMKACCNNAEFHRSRTEFVKKKSQIPFLAAEMDNLKV